MRIIAAYLLAVLGGNANPDKAAITRILDSVGAKADEERIAKLLTELQGKDLAAVIKAGMDKMVAVGPVAAPAAAAPAKEEGKGKKDEKPKAAAAAKEPEPAAEEEQDIGVGGMFD